MYKTVRNIFTLAQPTGITGNPWLYLTLLPKHSFTTCIPISIQCTLSPRLGLQPCSERSNMDWLDSPAPAWPKAQLPSHWMGLRPRFHVLYLNDHISGTYWCVGALMEPTYTFLTYTSIQLIVSKTLLI